MFVGNSRPRDLLEASIANKAFSQAYIFSGPEGVGKFYLAKAFASAIILGKGKIDKGCFSDNAKTLGDLMILEPEIEEKKGIKKEKKISIESVRESINALSLYPSNGDFKVLIINNAHQMTQSAQSSLLKKLEEPNNTSIIILVTHKEGMLITTIKSRCHKLTFSHVGISDIMKLEGISDIKGRAEEIYLLSLGKPGLANKMAKDEDELEFRRGALDKLKSFSNMGINEKINFAEELSRDENRALSMLEFWIWFLHSKALENPKIFSIIEKINGSVREIRETNVNTRLALENLFLNL